MCKRFSRPHSCNLVDRYNRYLQLYGRLDQMPTHLELERDKVII